MLAYQAWRAGRKMYKKDWLYWEEAQRIRGRDETCTNGDNLIILPVAMRLGDTPVPIPNTTVKTQAADGTALETMWESRWPPDQKKENWVYQWSEILNEDLRFLMTDKISVREWCKPWTSEQKFLGHGTACQIHHPKPAYENKFSVLPYVWCACTDTCTLKTAYMKFVRLS